MVPFVLAGWGNVNQHRGALDHVGQLGRGEIINGFFMTAPGNPIIKRCLDQIVDNVNRYDEKFDRLGASYHWSTGTVGRYGVLQTTGPYSNTRVMWPLLPNCPHLFVPCFRNLGINFYGKEGHDHHIQQNGTNMGDVDNIHYTKLNERVVMSNENADFSFGGRQWWDDVIETIDV